MVFLGQRICGLSKDKIKHLFHTNSHTGKRDSCIGYVLLAFGRCSSFLKCLVVFGAFWSALKHLGYFVSVSCFEVFCGFCVCVVESEGYF